ncbi:MAG: glycine cleavage system protein GcvH [Oscillatoriales cyanobacterium]|nr:MAG: glycine cleavage system protein GcvH [Oscillatoriales cyanobacterium]
MSLSYPDDLKYSDSHEYLRLEEDIAVIGITAFAIDQLGDIVFVDLPEAGRRVEPGEDFGTIESVKAVSSLYSTVSGVVVKVNHVLIDHPECVVEDPYGEGWLVQVRIDNPGEIDRMMSAEAYRSLVEGL